MLAHGAAGSSSLESSVQDPYVAQAKSDSLPAEEGVAAGVAEAPVVCSSIVAKSNVLAVHGNAKLQSALFCTQAIVMLD